AARSEAVTWDRRIRSRLPTIRPSSAPSGPSQRYGRRATQRTTARIQRGPGSSPIATCAVSAEEAGLAGGGGFAPAVDRGAEHVVEREHEGLALAVARPDHALRQADVLDLGDGERDAVVGAVEGEVASLGERGPAVLLGF